MCLQVPAYVCIKPITYCFLENSSKSLIVHQVFLSIQNHEDIVEVKNKKTGAIFVDLTAAYDNCYRITNLALTASC